MKGPANQQAQGGTTFIPFHLGHVVETVLKSMTQPQAEVTLDSFNDEAGRLFRNRIINEMNNVLISLAHRVDVGAEQFNSVRIQVTAITSILGAMNQHGQLFLTGEHPLTGPQDQEELPIS
jgi:hypothetical protein